MSFNRNCHKCPPEKQQHVHEIEGNVQIGGCRNELHSHCFETETGEAIPCGNSSHYHDVEFKTSIDDCHCHTFCGKTGPAIQAGFGEHIHLLESVTSCNDGHKHCIRVATGTEEPVGC